MKELTPQDNSLGTTPQLQSLAAYEKLARAIFIKVGRFRYSDIELSELVGEMMLGDLKGTKYGRSWKIKSYIRKVKIRRHYTLQIDKPYSNEMAILNVDLEDLLEEKKIPENDKKILFDHYYNRKTLREIGEEQQITTNVVWYRIKRTIKQLCS